MNLFKRRQSWTIGATVVAMALASACSADDGSSATGTPKLRIVVAALDPVNAQLWLADQAGLFDKAGVDVTIEIGAANTVPLVAGGRADIAMIGPGAALATAEQGKSTTIIYSYAGGGVGAFVAGAPGTGDLENCERMAMIGVGTTTYAWAQLFKSETGATYDLVPVQDTPTVPQTVVAGNADCAITTYSALKPYLDDNRLELIFDPREADSLSAENRALSEGVLWGLTDNLNNKSDAVSRFLRAFRAAGDLIADETSADLAERLAGLDGWDVFTVEQLTELLELNKPLLDPTDGELTAEAWDSELAWLRAGGLEFIEPDEDRWSYDQRVNLEFLDAGTS